MSGGTRVVLKRTVGFNSTGEEFAGNPHLDARGGVLWEEA